MASSHARVTFVAIVLIAVACTNDAGSPPEATAPPDAFAPTPTIGEVPSNTLAPSTTVDGDRVVLQRVDAVSLQPRTAFEPIPMSDWMWGPVTSPDRRFMAAWVNDDRGNTELRLIDLLAWAPVASWPESGDLIVDVNEHGSVYFVGYSSTPEFRFAAIDGASSTLLASLHPAHSVWGAEAVTDKVFVFWGTKPVVGSERTEQAFVATSDLDHAGAITEIPLPEVQIGSVDPVSQGPWAPYLYTSPSFTWDPIGLRLLVVHADKDLVSEIDPLSGTVSEHPLGGAIDLGSGARRVSAISPDGDSLYVATRAVELIEDDDDWTVRTAPVGVATFDTTTWEMAMRTDEPIAEIWVSPSDDLILGSGYTTEESETVYVSEATGLYMLDSHDLSTRVHYAPEVEDQTWGPVTFSQAGSIAYVSTWLATPRLHALELASGEILSTVESVETLEMIGPVGVLASNR